ncbi:MAG: hypothetical protein WA851_08635 [Xanthobacteraceae bacterium]
MFSLRMASRRRCPPPWRIQENDESYVVMDANGQRLAFIYFEDEPVRQSSMKRIGKDDAWQLARAIVRIPGLLQRD